MKYEVDGKIFDSEEEAIEFCAEEMISTANILEVKEEDLSEEDSLTEEQYDNMEFIKEVAENWDKVPEKNKEGLLRHMFGSFRLSREGDKVKVVLPTLKYEPKNVQVSNAVEEAYVELLTKIQDLERHVCPICNRPYSENLDETEDLSWREQHKDLAGRLPLVRVTHIRAKHPAIWSFISELFPKTVSERRYDDKEISKPKHVSGSFVQKESLSEMSKVELSKAINESEELRRQFFKRWLQKLGERE